MNKTRIAGLSTIEDRTPAGARVAGIDLVIVRYDDSISVLYGRCVHRGAHLSDGFIRGDDLVCGVHHWDYRYETGISSYNPSEKLHKFSSWVENDDLFVDADEIAVWAQLNPQPWVEDAYQGLFQDHSHHSDRKDEPHVKFIRRLAAEGIEGVGHHGPIGSMGVPSHKLPSWDSIQLVTAQLSERPVLDDEPVVATTIIGPSAAKPLQLDMPIFVSDMSFGSLSAEAKVALARGSNTAGTAICSGEGGMLPEERAENPRYLYELASGKFGWSIEKVEKVAGFHFKFGQGAKTGTGGHLPAHKVTERIAEVRDLPSGQPAISPATFVDLTTLDDFRALADEVREVSGGIPIGAKLSAQHIEDDIDAVLQIGVDYIILDGRGGGTGAAPLMFRDHIGVPTIPALARARRHLDVRKANHVSLVITGGLRIHTDFVKALALGADAIAVSNAAMQAIGCIGMRACATDNCPVGIATQQEHLRERLPVDEAAGRLARFFEGTVDLMRVLARACGHRRLSDFTLDDLTTFDRDMAHLAGVSYGGVSL